MSDKTTFGTRQMARALGDITNTDPKAEGSKLEAEGHGAEAADWGGKIQYDYQTYNATGEENRQAAAAADTEDPEDSKIVAQWASNAAKYEWDEDFGDVGPPNPRLELQLFGDENIPRAGQQVEVLQEIPVTVHSEDKIYPVKSFLDAALHPIMLQNIALCRYSEPTPIQAYCIPAVITGHDVIACAQTGSGKTAAYLIPVISRLMGKAKRLAAPRPLGKTFNYQTDAVRAEPLVLVVAPTRELASQIFTECRRFCYRSMLRPCVIYGGAPIRDQTDDLAKGCDILVATPGRLKDLMNRSHVLSMCRLKYTIIDEADELLHDDWKDELSQILFGSGIANSDADRVFMLFSATFNKHARAAAKEIAAKDHMFIKVGRSGSTTMNILQRVYNVVEESKKQALFDLITSSPPARTLVFVNSKRTADYLDDFFFNAEYPSTSFHADRTQREREDALNAFRRGKTPIMIATGISARGLDVANVMHVINYDLPSTMHGGIDEYVHRIGRCGRIGHTGIATSFYNDRNDDIAEDLCKLLLETRQEIPDFLEPFVPEGAKENLDFGDLSDEDEHESEAAKSEAGSATHNSKGASSCTLSDAASEDKPVKAEPAEMSW